MKRKIILLTAALMMFMGVVSASSINGDYKGNPIVKITNGLDNSEIKTDIPAFIYEGNTMVPISALRELGAQVSWDGNTHTAKVSIETFDLAKSGGKTTKTIKEIMIEANETAKRWGSKNVQYVANELGDYVKIDVTSTEDADANTVINNIATMSTYLNDTNADMMFANIYFQNEYIGYYTILKNDANNISNFKSVSEYEKKWNWSAAEKGSVSTPKPPTITTAPSTMTTERAIESKIDGDFEGFESEKIFKLLNGQIWIQTSYDYKYSYKYSPKVTIYKDGTKYKMIVDGVDKTITVERIK